MVQFNFNAANYQPSEGQASVLPEGIYDVQAVKSETKETKARDGQAYLEMTLAVTQGPHMGKKIKARFNLWNRSEDAVQIAHAELCALALVVGVPYFQDTQQLHGRPFRVKVSCEERNDKPGSYSNNVVGYLDAWGNPPNPSNAGQSQGFQQSAPMQPPTNPGMQQPPMQSGQYPNPPTNPQAGTGQTTQYGNQQPPMNPQAQPPTNPGTPWQGNGMQNPNNPQSGNYPQGPNPGMANPGMGQQQPPYGTPDVNSTGMSGMGNAPAPMGNADYGTPPQSGSNWQPNGPQGNPGMGPGGPMMGNPGQYQEQPQGSPQSGPVAGPGSSPPPNYGNPSTTPPWGQ